MSSEITILPFILFLAEHCIINYEQRTNWDVMLRGWHITGQLKPGHFAYAIKRGHLGCHDYMSANKKPLMKHEYVYHVRALLMEKISFLPLLQAYALSISKQTFVS